MKTVASLPSRVTREALKTALAMVLTYGIALALDWDKTIWAGLAVAMVSMDSLGLSLNKGMMRMLGTMVAAIAALVLVGLFPQDRWLFMIALSLWLGFCTYLMLDSRRAYFWQVCGFVSVIICVSAATSQLGVFETAVLRAQETGLGILVYSLIAMLLWPSHSEDMFLNAVSELHQKQSALYQKLVTANHAAVDIADTTAKLGELTVTHRKVMSLLDASNADSYEIWEARDEWQQYAVQCRALNESLEQLVVLAPGSAGQPIAALIPSLPEFDATIRRRFNWLAEPQSSLDDSEMAPAPTLSVDEVTLSSLSLYDAGSIAVFRRQLHELDTITEGLAVLRARIEGRVPDATYPGTRTEVPIVSQPSITCLKEWVPDWDRLVASIRVIFTLWIAYFIYIYVEGVPTGPNFVTLTGALAMAMATAPFVPAIRLVPPVFLAAMVGAVIYLVIMPNLYAFWQLGLLLFVVSFLIYRFFASPAAQALRLLAFTMFISVCIIQNAQTYSFMAAANVTLSFILVLILLSMAAYIPISPRPERLFCRYLKRFFLTAGRFFTDNDEAAGSVTFRSALGGWRGNVLRQELATLPVKISDCASRVPARFVQGDSRDALGSLVASISALAFFMLALARHRPSHWRELDTLRPWRESMASALFSMAESIDGAGEHGVDYRALAQRLRLLLSDLEAEVRSDITQHGVPGASEVEQWLCRVGLLRGIGQSLLALRQATEKFDWTQWDAQRFFEK